MNKQELNTKLAEWAGIECRKVKIHDKQIGGEFEGFDWEKEMYIFPDGSMSKELNFTQSLSACFEWLVPLVIDKIMGEQGCSSDVAYAILFKKWLQELELIIPDAALALCLAISKNWTELVRKTGGII